MSLFNIAEYFYLAFVFGSGTPSSYSLGLSTDVLDDTGVTGEPVGNGYARVSIINDRTNFPFPSTGVATTTVNGAAFTFPAATGSWGTVKHWFLWDDDSGIPLVHGPLTSFRAVESGDLVLIPAGWMIITLD